MDDLALTKLLLGHQQKMVVLVGEPLSRLSAVLSDTANSLDIPIPHILNSNSIDDYISGCRAIDRQISECVLCLHLPAGVGEPQKRLGLACRTSPRFVLVEHTQNRPGEDLFEDEQFYAFGFRRIGETTAVSGLQRRWYTYSLRDYKQAPDWLNARFWAHPERFDVQE